MLLDLPEAPREDILRFLSVHSTDRLSLAGTCRPLLQEVEAFSKKELDRITNEHAVNDDWLYRVGMQAAALGQESEDWQMPASVSHRRMLRSAYRTHIYSLGTDPTQPWTGVLGLAMHSDGKRLLSGGQGSEGDSTILRLWDVEAKRCIRSFVGHTRDVDSVCFSAGYAVSFAWEEGSIRIWNMSDGSCRHSVEIEKYYTGRITTSNEEVFVPIEEEGVSRAINIHTGNRRQSPEHAWCKRGATVELSLCGDCLLASVPHDEGNFDEAELEQEYARLGGIYILERSTLEVVSEIKGIYQCIKSAANGDVVAITKDGLFCVFRLQEDKRLLIRNSFYRKPSIIDSFPFYDSILLVHDSRLYVEEKANRRKGFSAIDVYNMVTGNVERTLCYPHGGQPDSPFCLEAVSPFCLVAGTRTLFCGFNSAFGGEYNATCSIKAYLLE